MNQNKLNTTFNNILNKMSNKNSQFNNVQVLLYSGKEDYLYEFKPNNGVLPFHVASIGKVFTATCIMMLYEEGKLHLDDCICKYLDRSLLTDLFVFEGIDYSENVTIDQLLAHTSGCNDYFEGIHKNDENIVDDAIKNPEKFYHPIDLLEFSALKQKAVAKPGTTFAYSDTGYILLGLILETVERKALGSILEERIFSPLQMHHSYLMFYSNKHTEIAPVWIQNVEVSTYNSLSVDWAGGGVISTLKDLVLFQKALHSFQLISEKSLHLMIQAKHKYHVGIHYGLGMMSIRFEEFFFLLKGYPQFVGHTGVLATHMYYDKDRDLHFIMNVGSDAAMNASFKMMIKMVKYFK